MKKYEKDLVERTCFEYGFFSVHFSRHFNDGTVYTLITNSKGDTLQSGKYTSMSDALQDIKQYIESMCAYAGVLLSRVNKLCNEYKDDSNV